MVVIPKILTLSPSIPPINNGSNSTAVFNPFANLQDFTNGPWISLTSGSTRMWSSYAILLLGSAALFSTLHGFKPTQVYGDEGGIHGGPRRFFSVTCSFVPLNLHGSSERCHLTASDRTQFCLFFCFGTGLKCLTLHLQSALTNGIMTSTLRLLSSDGLTFNGSKSMSSAGAKLKE